MKCVAYVSKAPINQRGIRLPVGMSDIVKIARKFNSTLDITGIIAYRQGQYFQVLEGPTIEVDSLMSKISKDPRHDDIWIFLDVPITERSFPTWGVSVFDFVDQGSIFKKFIHNNRHMLDNLSESQRLRIQPFIDLNVITTEFGQNYQGKNLRLLAWPDLNRVKQPQMIISLCVKLTKKPYPFDRLVDEGEFGSYEELTKIIREFEVMGILSVTKPEPLQQQIVPQKKKPNNFYGAIKRFLGMG